MPTYQYACTECGEQLEVVQKFSDEPLAVCPQCEGRLRKVFSAVGVVFKGSGFYRTDSRNSSSSASTAAKSNDSAGSSGSESKTAESKTAESKASSNGSPTSSSSSTSSSSAASTPAA